MEKDVRELYDLEYKGCAERYERIYQATWTQFNYFLVAAGVLLGFGKDAVGLYVAGALACLALIFWFWATFEPLNRYGDQVAKRAAELEGIYNRDVFKVKDALTTERVEGMKHFTAFEERRKSYDKDSNDLKRLRTPMVPILVATAGMLLSTLLATPHGIIAVPKWLGTLKNTGVWLGILTSLAASYLGLYRFYGLTQPDKILNSKAQKSNSVDADPTLASIVGLLLSTVCSCYWCFAFTSGAVHDKGTLGRCVGPGVIIATGILVGCFAPALLFKTPTRRSVRVPVRFAGALLHFALLTLICAQVGLLINPKDEQHTEVHLRVDPQGNVTFKGESPPSK